MLILSTLSPFDRRKNLHREGKGFKVIIYKFPFGAQTAENLPTVQETWLQFLGQGSREEKGFIKNHKL